MVLRMTVGLVLLVAAFAIAGRRLWWLGRVARAGQPAPERTEAVRTHPRRDVTTESTEVLGQRKLLKWTVPGVAHALTFWGFTILLLTIIESYGSLFSRTFSLPWIGHWAFVGFIEDLAAVGVLVGQRAEQHGMDEGKDCRIGADAEAESQDDGDGEAAGPGEAADGVLELGNEHRDGARSGM